MPRLKRQRRPRTDDWQQIKQYVLWPEQEVYEILRPVVLYGETAALRAKETGAAERTISRKAEAFEQVGMVSLFATERAPGAPQETTRSLPPPLRQLIVDLHAELPTMSLREIAEVCSIRFGRRPSHHSVKLVLASGPRPSLTTRRYPSYAQIPDPAECRLAIIRLHSEGWSISTISAYLQVSRPTVYATLQRWAQEGVRGLDDKSRARKALRKVTLEVANEIRKRQENPLLGEQRMHAALLQIGIQISPATCGRIMAQHRRLYGLPKPERSARPKREMPFKARYRHEWWSIDVRSIEKHQIPDIPGPVYVIRVLENCSRAVLASAISRTQDTQAFLEVLFAALRKHGAPAGIVTDGGAIFTSHQAMRVYQALGIRKDQIEAGKPWQNYIEALFSIQRRMVDYAFAKATTWAELLQAHQRWMIDYNAQEHWAHRERQDGRHSPQDVLDGTRGRDDPEAVLARVLFATPFLRHLDRSGYVRFRHWRLYGEEGLAGADVTVWVSPGTLKIEYQATALALYSVVFFPESRSIQEVRHPRLIETHFRSPQLSLWT